MTRSRALGTLGLACLILLPRAADAACTAIRAESDIAGVRLADEASTARILGPWDALPSEQPKDGSGLDAGFAFARVRSASGRQEARFFTHYGSVAGAYGEIEVLPADGEKPAKRLPAAELATERGVRLGMLEADLIRLLGPCFRREHGRSKVRIIHYAVTDPKHALLRRAGYPSYFARYVFVGGRLVRFRFGFEPV